MSFFNKLLDMKDTISYKLDDVKDFVADKTSDAKDIISDKVSDIKDFAEDAVYFVSEKAEDTKDFIVDKAMDTKEFVSDKAFDVRYFLEDKAFDAKYYITENVKLKSKADVAEAASYVLFPAQIPVKLLMSSLGRSAATSIQEKQDDLNRRIYKLEWSQSEGKRLSDEINASLKEIAEQKKLIHQQLEFFSSVFEKIHNRPTYKIDLEGGSKSFDELFRHSPVESDFAFFDSYLLKIYDEDAGILEGIMRGPVFAAILKFREKALQNKIENVMDEVNDCIEHMKTANAYLLNLSSKAKKFAKELHDVEEEFWNIVYALSEVVEKKPDFQHFNKDDLLLLDTNIKMVRIIVKLLNTHLFETGSGGQVPCPS